MLILVLLHLVSVRHAVRIAPKAPSWASLTPRWPGAIPSSSSGRTRRSGRRKRGSNPCEGALAGVAQKVERFSCKEDVAGSIPVSGSTAVAAIRAGAQGDAQVCRAVLQTAPDRFDTDVVHARHASVAQW
jgi:hypothetical protein